MDATGQKPYIRSRHISLSGLHLCPIIMQLSRSDHRVRFENEAEIWGDKLSGTKSRPHINLRTNKKNSGYSLLGPTLKSAQRRICLNLLP